MAKRILIVEDDANILISLTFLMENCGYLTRTCANGHAALAAAEAFLPHLVLLDIMLPGLNGYEVCRALRANPAHAQTRIVVLSAKGRESEIAQARELGADAYLTKPFATREVTDTVRRLFEAS
jgi:DNA-binding response OmpR family regulator